MPVSEETFKRISMEDPDGHWELDDGCLRQKPEMTYRHSDAQVLLGHMFLLQLAWDEYVVRIDNGLVRRSETRYYIPDVMVLRRADADRMFPDPDTWEVYTEPLLLVVEVWAPSTGRTDVTSKLPEYQRRGDLEIWLLHPVERTLRVWVRQDDGSYQETFYGHGLVAPSFLPGVSIDLDEFFRRLR